MIDYDLDAVTNICNAIEILVFRCEFAPNDHFVIELKQTQIVINFVAKTLFIIAHCFIERSDCFDLRMGFSYISRKPIIEHNRLTAVFRNQIKY